MRDWLNGLPPAVRWGGLGLAALLVLLIAGTGTWAFLGYRETLARQAFATASASYREAMATPDDARRDAAAKALMQFLADHSRSAATGQGWYFLGNVEYQRRRYDAALTAFGEAARRDTGTIGALSRLGTGYAWEAKGDAARALEAYGAALKGRGAKDFLYTELMLAVARVQEQLKQPAAAIQTYRQLLKESPDSARTDEIRTRLAILGASA